MSSKPTKHYIAQRFTALIQIPLVIWLVFGVIGHAGDTQDQFRVWLSEPLTASLMIIFILSVFFHMHLGMGEVVDDYIHKPSSRSLLNRVNQLVALVLAVLAVFAVAAITFIA
ncbi:hypothetical protein PB2503_04822 [Parvularcula bermudensis HTCC2503]|uniref:Succinate dehydrogenase hydrophobic membrane anchor subunit n=1 Tax=Parvularcula bermudensis (strain ATCC BAA-594 / HTCC2503 / KCTC 12087) TaxID=314260 RepID=E0TFC1_PARBH|nr:succinate dehydrogenase, hydrophobic membrane anchor protein [Parvularcula bermudensis]ADM09039.1 hypothetical protein PB2503_04822 [Parvularcula bermudensis HTCC2503]